MWKSVSILRLLFDHTHLQTYAFLQGPMGRVEVNLTLNANVAEAAGTLGLDMSRLAEAAISEAAKLERNRLWRAGNQVAINAYADEVSKEGLPLTGLKSLLAGFTMAQFDLYHLKNGSLLWPYRQIRSALRGVGVVARGYAPENVSFKGEPTSRQLLEVPHIEAWQKLTR
ncbi:type II toxin-antitoxin system CcdA family antitoxin [Sulfitobacter sp. 915]|uniref:type II toxin-antitoxin system CcdA family antitoxin n=1 Tax=Sulfitobacter sp. 915 TaxID=3368558 RepID=UPI003745A660